MSGTLYATGSLQTGVGFMISGLLGILFGFFLEQAGFGSSRKLTGIFYFRDMAVLKVMFTAVITSMVGVHYLLALGWLSQSQIYMLETFWAAQIVGGLIFGIGFVVGGWCPGTAVVGLASAKWDALVFLVGVILGSILFNEVFPLIQPLYEGMRGGNLFLWELLNLPPKGLILIVCLLAIGLFTLSTRIESRADPLLKPSKIAFKRHVLSAAVLVLMAAFLLIVPQRRPPIPEPVARAGFLQEVEQAGDHVDPMDLAHRVISGKSKITLVDLRSGEDYARFHLRGAIHIPLATLAQEADRRLPRDGLVVLYSNGTTHAAQAWTELRHWGWTNVKVLTDGLIGFWRECLTPPSLDGFTDEGTSHKRYKAFIDRKTFFIGSSIE